MLQKSPKKMRQTPLNRKVGAHSAERAPTYFDRLFFLVHCGNHAIPNCFLHNQI